MKKTYINPCIMFLKVDTMLMQNTSLTKFNEEKDAGDALGKSDFDTPKSRSVWDNDED